MQVNTDQLTRNKYCSQRRIDPRWAIHAGVYPPPTGIYLDNLK